MFRVFDQYLQMKNTLKFTCKLHNDGHSTPSNNILLVCMELLTALSYIIHTQCSAQLNRPTVVCYDSIQTQLKSVVSRVAVRNKNPLNRFSTFGSRLINQSEKCKTIIICWLYFYYRLKNKVIQLQVNLQMVCFMYVKIMKLTHEQFMNVNLLFQFGNEWT